MSREFFDPPRPGYDEAMCRSIKVLRNPAQPATPEEVSAAARQFIRKVSGFHKPSKANEPVFEDAIAEVARVTSRLLGRLQTRPQKAPEPEI